MTIKTDEVTPADVLWVAIQILEEDGWTQGAFSFNGKYCVVGAVSIAATRLGFLVGHPVRSDARRALLRAVGEEGPYIEDWNDAPERTYEDVILALKQAIELVEAP